MEDVTGLSINNQSCVCVCVCFHLFFFWGKCQESCVLLQYVMEHIVMNFNGQ